MAMFIFYCRIFATIMSAANATPTFRRSALVIGAGPVGLTAALALQKLEMFSEITIVERRSKSGFESNKAYLYLIDKRGQKLTDLLDLTTSIADRAVSSFLFPTLTEVLPNSVTRVQKLPVMDSPENEKFWIPRSELLFCLTEQIRKKNDEGKLTNIRLLYETACDGFHVGENGKVHVHISAGDEGGQEVCADLMVACDGISSAVRSWLETTEPKFKPISLPSAAAGLRYKMLTLKHRFPLPRQDGAEPLPSVPEQKYVFRSVNQTLTARVNLGLLSVKGEAKRTANIICVPQHIIWQLTSFADVKQFLVESFPQIDFPSFVDDDEIERFAQSAPGVFPQPQYVEKMQTIAGRKGEEQQGIVVVGDAAHAFPPDLGQGVNSGLDDVFSLYVALREENCDFAKALPAYEQRRAPEAKAICRLMQFGYVSCPSHPLFCTLIVSLLSPFFFSKKTRYPYQYNQAIIMKNLCLANFALRMLLNKIMPFVFSPPAFFMVQGNPELSYAQVSVCPLTTCHSSLQSPRG